MKSRKPPQPDTQHTWNESVRAELDSHQFNIEQLASRIRLLEKMIDTRATSIWKRMLFRIDGWPPWYTVAQEPNWRPWRRWWRS